MPTYRLNYQGTLHAAEEFQYGISVTGSGTLSDAATAAAAAYTAMMNGADFDDQFDDGIVWNACLVQQIPDGGGTVIDAQIAAISDAGVATTGSLPNQCATVVSLLTGLSGSRNRGRMFLPPVAKVATTDAGRLSTTARAALAAGLTAFKNELIGDGFTPVLVSTSQNANIVLTALRVGDVIDTMRSRRTSLAEVYTTITV